MMEAPTYVESLKIGWAIFWRTVGSFIALLFAINLGLLFLVPELSRAGPSIWIALVPLGVVSGVCLFVVMPHVARMLLDRPFHGFQILFVRDAHANMGTPMRSSGEEG